MIKEEIKSLLHNKLLLVVMAAIILIPSIYAGLFLSSMWDPYGDLEYLPVAVVNKDVPVIYKDERLAVGEKLTEELADNASMAFNIVDETTAFEGLENGTYYMVITIPEDFSNNASTVMDDEPKQMVLQFATNPGKNYISMKLSESAIKQIKENIMEQVTTTYTEAVFDSLGDVAEGFDKAVDGTNEMLDGEDKLIDGNKEITDNLVKLTDGALTFTDGTEELKVGLKDYMAGADKINDGASQLSAGTSKLNSSVPTYTKGVSSAKDGSDKLVANNTTLNNGIASVGKGISDLLAGVTKLEDGLKTMKTGVDASLTDENVAQIQLASSKLIELNTGIQALNAAVNGENNALDGMTAALTGVGGNIMTAGSKLQTVDADGNITGGVALDLTNAGVQVQTAGANTQAAGAKVTTAATDLGQVLGYMQAAQTTTLTGEQVLLLQDALAQLADPTGQSADNAAGYLGAVGVNLTQSGVELNNAKNDLTAAGAELQTAGATLTALSQSGGTATLQAAVAQVAEGADQLLPASSGALDSLLSGLQTIQTGLNQTTAKDGKSGLIEGVGQVKAGLVALNTGVNGDAGLKNGIKTYTDGVGTLNNGLKELASHNGELNSGVSDLNKGANTLAEGTATLVSNNGKILDGIDKLSDGADTIADGAGKLADGSGELGEGLATLKSGTDELNTALAEGADEVRANQASDKNIEMFVSPVTTEETMITEVANNGHAMAAYMLSVGLWVGCLAFCLMYPLVEYKGELKNGIAWWASKAIVAYPVAWIMALVAIVVLHLFLGFNPVEMAKTFGVAAMAVTAFMSIMYFFNIAFGKVGSFLMLIFMVLQLTGSAGTYPIEISGDLANKLHVYMPFTYTVDAFRSTIAGGSSVLTEILVLAAITVVFTLLTVIVFEIRGIKVSKDKKLIYEWIEEKGLA